jgi:hypothetical protein
MQRLASRYCACLAVCVALLGTGCASEGDSNTAEAVENALAAAAKEPSGTADIAKAVKGDWTRLVFVCAYSYQEQVDKDLGFAWSEYTPTEQDGAQTWVFATSTEVVTWAIVSGYHGDPCYHEGRNPPSVVARAEAVFRVEDTGERVIDGKTPYRALRPRQ